MTTQRQSDTISFILMVGKRQSREQLTALAWPIVVPSRTHYITYIITIIKHVS